MDKIAMIREVEYRKYIATSVKQLKHKADMLEGLLGEEWEDFAGARQTLNEILDNTDHLSKLMSKLEEIISEEESAS